MKKYILIGLIFLSVFDFAFAGGFKKYAGEFLNIGAGSRISAMAGAGTAVVNDVSAAYWNPAGLVQAKGFQIQFTHGKQFISSIQHDYIALSHPVNENSTVGISLFYFTVNGIKDSRQAFNEADNKVDYSKIKTFNTGDYALYLTFARKRTEDLQYGLNVKMIYRDFNVENAFGLGFDFGLQYRWFDQVRLGLVLKDITGTMIAWSTNEKEFITPSMRMGLSYRFEWQATGLSVQPAVDLQVMFEGRDYSAQWNVGPMSLDSFWGLEVGYKHLIALRAGLDDLKRFNTGIGLNIPKISFDYAFTAYESELGNVHRISVHLFLNSLF
ncbi:MAG: PorV/PorQ family protein [Calditrichaeota bacterium]|nr:PorV/PorQ family protein [Calditrichota bacterium]